MTSPEPAEDPNDELLAQLKGTPTDAVEQATRRVEKFTEEDEEHDKRFVRSERRRTFHKIQFYFFWFLFVLTCAVIAVTAGGYLYLVWIWVSGMIWDVPIKDPDGLESFIEGVLLFLLVIFATLFFESVFRDRSN